MTEYAHVVFFRTRKNYRFQKYFLTTIEDFSN